MGYAYPGFECYKTVEKNKIDMEELRFWCKYWYTQSFSFLIFFIKLNCLRQMLVFKNHLLHMMALEFLWIREKAENVDVV